MVKIPKADVAPSASAQVVRGAVAGLPAFPQRLVPRHIVPASSRALRRANPPAVRSPAPGNTGPAAPGRPWHSGGFVRQALFRPLRARPRAGIRSGVGVAWRQSCTCGDLFWVPPPHLRSGFVFRFCWGVESVRTKEPLEVDPASLRSVTVQAASSPAECSGWLSSCLTSPCASPHSAPLRPPHTASLPASASGSKLFPNGASSKSSI